MLKKITYTFIAIAIAVIISQAGVQFQTQPPAGLTGAEGLIVLTAIAVFL